MGPPRDSSATLVCVSIRTASSNCMGALFEKKHRKNQKIAQFPNGKKGNFEQWTMDPLGGVVVPPKEIPPLTYYHKGFLDFFRKKRRYQNDTFHSLYDHDSFQCRFTVATPKCNCSDTCFCVKP